MYWTEQAVLTALLGNEVVNSNLKIGAFVVMVSSIRVMGGLFAEIFQDIFTLIAGAHAYLVLV